MPAIPSSSTSPTPPLSCSSSSYSRNSDAPPSSKKRRLNSAQFNSTIAPTPLPDYQLDAARRAVSNRILSIWSSLEQKYACRLDEDDIVDLRTGSIVKDRGVLSSSNAVFDFGCFSEHDNKADDIDNEGTENEEDELGGWGSDLELDQQFSEVCRPVRVRLDPADADDLEEFLVAERLRKQGLAAQSLLGEEEQDDNNDEGEEEKKKEEEEEEEEDEEDEEEEEEVVEEGEQAEEQEHEGGNKCSGQASDSSDDQKDPIIVGDMGIEDRVLYPSDESDDELAGYDATVGEGAMLWEVERFPDHSHTEHSFSSEPPTPDIFSTKICRQASAHPQHPTSRSLPSTPRRTSTSLNPNFKASSSLIIKRHETDMPVTTLTPITQRLSLKGTERRAVSVSPTKKLVPEVVLPRFKVSPLRLNTGKISNAPSPVFTKGSRANSPQKMTLKRKHSLLSDNAELKSQADSHIDKPVIPRKDPSRYFDRKFTSENTLEQSVDRSQDNPKFDSSIPTEEQRLSSDLSTSSHENKPRVSPTDSPATPRIPAPPYVFPLMPYSPYISPDWSMHYRQNQTPSSSVYSPDPRFYLAQAMHNLSFFLNPTQIANTQTPWPYPLSPAPIEMSHAFPAPPSQPMPSSVPPDQKIANVPNFPPPGDSPSAQLPFQKPCLKKVSFSPTLPYSSPPKSDPMSKLRSGRSGSTSMARKGPLANHDKQRKEQR